MSHIAANDVPHCCLRCPTSLPCPPHMLVAAHAPDGCRYTHCGKIFAGGATPAAHVGSCPCTRWLPLYTHCGKIFAGGATPAAHVGSCPCPRWLAISNVAPLDASHVWMRLLYVTA
eukprot:366389-Chlamydomonas_euryale.AAC.1